MPHEINFEWDPKKAANNLRKHGVGFERAASVFQDPEAVSLYDSKHDLEEDRWIRFPRGIISSMSHVARD